MDLATNEAIRQPTPGGRGPAFSYLREVRTENEGFVDQTGASWNRILRWLGTVDGLRHAA
jgi:hypothetical protein